MKPYTIPTVLGLIFIYISYITQPKRPSMVIDLPEEWQTISQDPTKPDLMVAHISCDTIYLRFDN